MDKKQMLKMAVCELARRGSSMLEIMKETGTGERFIRNTLKEAGMKPKYKPVRISPEMRANVIRMHNAGMTRREIAIELGISTTSVSTILRTYPAEEQQENEEVQIPLVEEIPLAEEHEVSALDMLENALEMALQAVRKMKEG